MDQVVKKERDSNLELFRIITMIAIVAHHYVVNSGLLADPGPVLENYTSWRSIFLIIFGAWGKIGINCFVLITGYFMCKSQITLKKFLKLVCEVYFYNAVIAIVFFAFGYENLTASRLFSIICPVSEISQGFTPCYLVFFLCLPFLKVLVSNLNEKQHVRLLVLSLIVFSVLGTIPFFDLDFNYVTWFIVLYFVASYVRLYDRPIFNNTSIWSVIAASSVVVSILSIVVGIFVGNRLDMNLHYYFISDSNKILAVITSFSLFMCFKNLKVRYSKIINKIAASSFGVLLIHANCDAMRHWLWCDTLKNVDIFNSSYMVLHAVVSVIGVYVICTLIDMLRIEVIEKPFFKMIDNKVDLLSKKLVIDKGDC